MTMSKFSLVPYLRKLYRHSINSPWLDKKIYFVLDLLADYYSRWRGYSFPNNYIRRWKLDMLWELYEKDTLAVFKKIIKPDMIAIDIGAHIGYYTRIFSKMVGSGGVVLAFEADPENFLLLKKNTQQLANVKIFQLALSDHAGIIDFYHCLEKAGCHTTLANAPLNFKMQKISVPANTLDTVLAQENIANVQVIKIDIEGGEAAALTGMAQTMQVNKNLAVITEFAPAWIKAAGKDPLTVLQQFKNNNFSIFAIANNKLSLLTPINKESYEVFIPKLQPNGSAYNQFVNLYCAKGIFLKLIE